MDGPPKNNKKNMYLQYMCVEKKRQYTRHKTPKLRHMLNPSIIIPQMVKIMY